MTKTLIALPADVFLFALGAARAGDEAAPADSAKPAAEAKPAKTTEEKKADAPFGEAR